MTLKFLYETPLLNERATKIKRECFKKTKKTQEDEIFLAWFEAA